MSDGHLFGFWGDIAFCWAIVIGMLACMWIAVKRHGKMQGHRDPLEWESQDSEPESGLDAVRKGYVGERCPSCFSLRVERNGPSVRCLNCQREFVSK